MARVDWAVTRSEPDQPAEARAQSLPARSDKYNIDRDATGKY